MFRPSYLARDPISFVGFPWRTTTNLVRGLLHHTSSLSPMHNVEVSTLSNPKTSPPVFFMCYIIM